MSLQGCDPPYLVGWSHPEIPQLSDYMSAARSWDLAWIREILKSGMNVDAREIGTERTALIWAAADPRIGVPSQVLSHLTRLPDNNTVKFLLESGADPNQRDVEGVTAVMRADAYTAGLLLAASANPNAHDSQGWTPLIHRSRQGDLQTVKLLLAAGADINATDKNGWTALMHAASEGRVEIVGALLARSADRSMKDSGGRTARDIVLQHRNGSLQFQQIVKLLSRTH